MIFKYYRSAITFLRRYNFDGLDFDWEYPTLRQGGRPQDRANYALLVKVRRGVEKSWGRGMERGGIDRSISANLKVKNLQDAQTAE
jgi:GH18 family chitinase